MEFQVSTNILIATALLEACLLAWGYLRRSLQ